MLTKTHIFIQPDPARNRGLKSLRDQKTLSLLFRQKLLLATALGLLPRSEKQVSNFKTKLAHASICPTVSHDGAADDLFCIMQQAYCKDSCHKFVQSVNTAREPAIVVSTDLQLQDLTRFCTLAFCLFSTNGGPYFLS